VQGNVCKYKVFKASCGMLYAADRRYAVS